VQLPRRGEVWWWESEETGGRPVVVLSRSSAIVGRRWTMIAPCTTTIRNLDTEVVLEPGEDPVGLPSVVNLDSVEQTSIGHLTRRVGMLSSSRMQQVCQALEIATEC
jgi:mRNA interferase MazF